MKRLIVLILLIFASFGNCFEIQRAGVSSASISSNLPANVITTNFTNTEKQTTLNNTVFGDYLSGTFSNGQMSIRQSGQTTQNYAFGQNSSGTTYINAASGQAINYLKGGTAIGVIDSTNRWIIGGTSAIHSGSNTKVQVIGDAIISGIVTASRLEVTNLNVTGNATFNAVVILGSGASVNGTVTANNFVGDGSGLTGISTSKYYVTPADYGAIPNDGADDTAQFQLFLNAISGNAGIIGAIDGVYNVGTITAGASTNIISITGNAIIYATKLTMAGSTINIEGIEFISNTVSDIFIQQYTPVVYNIKFNNCTFKNYSKTIFSGQNNFHYYWYFENCKFYNSDYGFYLETARDFEINYNYFYNCTRAIYKQNTARINTNYNIIDGGTNMSIGGIQQTPRLDYTFSVFNDGFGNDQIIGNKIKNVYEEAISYDCVGNQPTKPFKDKDTILSTSNFAVQLANPLWVGTGNVFANYYLIVSSGNNNGNYYKILSQSGATLNLRITQEELNKFSVGDGVYLGVPMAKSIIANNIIEGNTTSSAQTGIFLYGACYGNTVINNSVSNYSLRGIGLWNLYGVSDSGSRLDYTNDMDAICNKNTIIGNILSSSNISVRNVCFIANTDVSRNITTGNVIKDNILLNGSKLSIATELSNGSEVLEIGLIGIETFLNDNPYTILTSNYQNPVTFNNLYATITNPAQPSITSLGTLTSLGLSGTLSGTNGTFSGVVTSNEIFVSSRITGNAVRGTSGGFGTLGIGGTYGGSNLHYFDASSISGVGNTAQYRIASGYGLNIAFNGGTNTVANSAIFVSVNGTVGIGAICPTNNTAKLFVNGGLRSESLTVNSTVVFPGLGSGAATAVGVDGTGNLIQITSSKRFKENITDLHIDSSKIYNLRPVEFDYKNNGGHAIGYIAEEMQEIIPEIVQKDINGNPHSISYEQLIPLLIKEVKQLKSEIAELKSKVN